MPKLIDHDARRAEIVASTWQLIARQGFATTSLRQINREMGNAYGAIGHYFKTKNELLLAAFNHVYAATNARFEARGGTALHGLSALRALCEEIMPLDEERRLEARIAVPFWELALTDDDFAAVHAKATEQWDTQLRGWLVEAMASGEARADVDPATVSAQLISMFFGMQILAVASPLDYPAERCEQSFTALLAAAVAPPARPICDE